MFFGRMPTPWPHLVFHPIGMFNSIGFFALAGISRWVLKDCCVGQPITIVLCLNTGRIREGFVTHSTITFSKFEMHGRQLNAGKNAPAKSKLRSFNNAATDGTVGLATKRAVQYGKPIVMYSPLIYERAPGSPPAALGNHMGFVG
ncbi:hypothetical protein HYFRA_00001643 [Hymenoscyphus fraxineus]|uniref:Uncharacterized protein n=1 Tax=Hymenoscyphus fraxineus TaxID=746836 RepID=A0A9N9PZH9_9HELO|nr:hypothetical protein HYFRA_00001643 [Hymenoscyphus fraxineus]